jgi:hypothetical protein
MGFNFSFMKGFYQLLWLISDTNNPQESSLSIGACAGTTVVGFFLVLLLLLELSLVHWLEMMMVT